ncbi:ABC transporter permease [Simiduia aestuariiviva]|uniref:ABC-2 type transport system permease protein n=1 Tax=Simiduia aestuariiviva TaxID=1510459 RepID=A0A839USH9_9GAMM|nr:ABC transporter permease [Simiduia aestuariiviva]MBB3168335.1 ABC-2 type transport system permease protein [Simiduia aestuariiviva]
MLLALILKELHVLRRDLYGLAAIFLLPAAFIIIMSLALQDVYRPKLNTLKWVLIDNDRTDFSLRLAKHWQDFQQEPEAKVEDWRSQLATGQLDYAIIIERGTQEYLDNLVTANDTSGGIKFIGEPGLDFAVFQALTSQLRGLWLEHAIKSSNLELPTIVRQNIDIVDDFGAADENANDRGQGASELMDRLNTMVEGQRLGGAVNPSAVQHNVPAWLIFGMFFVVTSITGLLVEERSHGTFARLRSLGLSSGVILLGKLIPFVVVNLFQAAIMLAIGRYLLPLLGGEALVIDDVHWLALCTMLFSISFAATSLALWIATLVTSQTQAAAIGPAVNVLLAALGGIMVPSFVMPDVMQSIAGLSPMNWALEGLLDILIRKASFVEVAFEVGKLTLFGVLCLVLAQLALRKKYS